VGRSARGQRARAAAYFESGREKLAALGVALDPDDQSEIDWLADRLGR